MGKILSVVFAVLATATSLAMEPPSRPTVDAPELARLGPLTVGIRTLTLVEHNQLDVLSLDPNTGIVPRRDRTLVIDLWYPADILAGARTESYMAELPSEPPQPPARFTIPGIAFRNARPILGHYPLVIVSHGYSNATVALSWLTENLASKGYVVAAIRHEDPDISDRSKFAGPTLRRPLDLAFASRELQKSLGHEGLIDDTRTALVGYSMGGYGVLTAAGATLDPNGPVLSRLPEHALTPYARGGAQRDYVRVPNVRAVVGIAPAGGGTFAAWDASGLADIAAPLLLIAGNQDHTVDYTTGARTFFDAAIHVPRYLLTYREGGHGIGLDPVPDNMRGKLWDFDWFEDPVWRKERVVAVNLHMITAFLDLYVKGDDSRRSYLQGLVSDSDAGRWPRSTPGGYDSFSPGSGEVTLWKGFQNNHATGLSFEFKDSQAR
jgi:predicted dienelactone hydrolase